MYRESTIAEYTVRDERMVIEKAITLILDTKMGEDSTRTFTLFPYNGFLTEMHATCISPTVPLTVTLEKITTEDFSAQGTWKAVPQGSVTITPTKIVDKVELEEWIGRGTLVRCVFDVFPYPEPVTVQLIIKQVFQV
jgi:hypothetical protein